MSNKLKIKWTKPLPKNLELASAASMEIINFKITFYDEKDVEVVTSFVYTDTKAKSILGKGANTAERSIRGEPSVVFSEMNKSITIEKDIFMAQWLAAKALFHKKTPFHKAGNETFYNNINNYGMTPKRFAATAGVENSVLFRELKGQRKLSLDKAIHYAKALSCDPVDLLFEPQNCKFYGTVDLFNMNEAGNEDYWQGQIKPPPPPPKDKLKTSMKTGFKIGTFDLSDEIVRVPRDIYRPEIKAILIDSLGSYLHNHFAYYYRADNAAATPENKLVVVGRAIPELEELGMDTMQYFFGVLKIEQGKQKILNPEPTAEKRIICTGPFIFISPVVSLVRRGSMKKNYEYFQSISQAEEIRSAEDNITKTQVQVYKALKDELKKIKINMNDMNYMTTKQKKELKNKLNFENIYKKLDDSIPDYIKKKVG